MVYSIGYGGSVTDVILLRHCVPVTDTSDDLFLWFFLPQTQNVIIPLGSAKRTFKYFRMVEQRRITKDINYLIHHDIKDHGVDKMIKRNDVPPLVSNSFTSTNVRY